MGKRILIVGGVAGGASAAARLRRLDEDAEIILFERDGYISFANCGLPYYIGGTITERDHLMVQTPEDMNARFRIDVRIFSEVIQVDSDNKTVTVRSKDRGTYIETYDNLVLSPGAKPLKPTIPGIDGEKIFVLRNIPDTDTIKEFIDKMNTYSQGFDSATAIVIGGGFIGIEMAENLATLGMDITLVEAAPHILAPFDEDMVIMAEQELTRAGIKLVLGDGVKAFSDKNNKVEVTLASDTVIRADMIILAIGVTPDTGFLKDSKIELGSRGHIIVNERMQTSVSDVYAVGDAIEVIDFIMGSKTAIPLAGPANKQGRIAADNISGIDSVYDGSQGSSILKVFELTAASTGVNERILNSNNIPYHAILVHPSSHASYYPGASQMTIKLIFAKDGKIFGAQGIGYDGVDKRIDVIATVIRLKGTVKDLTKLELSYAPPYSSAKDPVNMVGYVAENVLNGIANMITWNQVLKLDSKNYLVVDVRTDIEYHYGHVKGAINIPIDDLRERLSEIPIDKLVLIYCQVGVRGYLADRILSQKGYNVKNITGGYQSISAYEEDRGNSAIEKFVRDSSKSIDINPDTQRLRSAEVENN
jgi:NADPH-dependent 2,4-dienoyl-CoA reductase/sulfur reductase-like enzyme/rhodanese-related sulfurtransferase